MIVCNQNQVLTNVQIKRQNKPYLVTKFFSTNLALFNLFITNLYEGFNAECENAFTLQDVQNQASIYMYSQNNIIDFQHFFPLKKLT